MLDAGVVNTEQELIKPGRSLLLSAREGAAEQDVATGTIICTGERLGKVKNTARKENVSLVVLEQPAGEESVFDRADLEAIADEIEDEVGVEACII